MNSLIKSFLALLIAGWSFGALAQPTTTQPSMISSVVTNSGSTGTTLNKLAKINSSGQALIVATSDTDKAVGVVISNAGTTGAAQIAYSGIVNCVFDAATTAGNYVRISTVTAGNCADTGGTTRPTGQTIGQVLSTNGSGGTYKVLLLLDAPSSSGSGTVTSVTCNGGQTIITTSGTCASREVLTGNRTYYVRTDGNDSFCTGLTDAAYVSGAFPQNCAFVTIQKAIAVTSSLDINIYNVTIQVRNGTYTGVITLASILGSGSVTILGDTVTPSNVTLNVVISAITGADIIGNWNVSGVKIISGGNGISLSGPSSTLNFSAVDFGVNTSAHINVGGGARVSATGAYSISGGATFHAIASGGTVAIAGYTVTLSGTPAFSAAFVYTEAAGYIRAFGMTFSGTGATGKRYDSNQNGLIVTNGGGASYFPGSIAGTVATQGQYL